MDQPTAVVLLALCAGGCGSDVPAGPTTDVEPTFDYPLDDTLRLHHMQTKGTHNSYHVESDGNELLAWNYSHVPLNEQADAQGVRQFELDLRLNVESGAFEVVHIPLLDEGTNCFLFTDCLATLRQWSDAHRAHHALVVQLELKDTTVADYESYFAQLHAAIESVWPAERVITPDEVQGGDATLAEAVASRGWPTLGELRGKVIFTLDDGGDFQRAYTFERTSLAGRLIFAHSSPDDAFAAFAVLNDPVGSADAIAAALAANMLVRTRADADVEQAAANDVTRRDAALASGAHFVTSDFPAPTAEFDYWLEIPGGTPTRCNPITAPGACTSEAIEDPAQLDQR